MGQARYEDLAPATILTTDVPLAGDRERKGLEPRLRSRVEGDGLVIRTGGDDMRRRGR